MLGRSVEGDGLEETEFVQGVVRVFGLPIVDSLLPDGVPVPCSVLITGEPGSGSDIISTAIVQEHLSSSLSVPFQEQKVLWLSLDNFVNDLRNGLDYLSATNQPKIQFIDCYSSQIGIDSKERYSADPSNLPYLSMVTSTAISEMNGGGRLLVVLDSLTSLLQKVGVRRSLEYFRTLVGKTRSISADVLTTLNRRAFTEATIATFADIADLVIDLAVEDNETSAGKLRVRKARNVRELLGWRKYRIDFDRRTFLSASLPSTGPGETADDVLLSTPDSLPRNQNHPDLENGSQRFAESERAPTISCPGPYCTFGGRAITERERLAIFAESMSVLGLKYQDTLRRVAQSLATQIKTGRKSNSNGLLKDVNEVISRTERAVKMVQTQTRVHPSTRRASIDEVIERALTESPVPSSVGVVREPDGSMEVQMDTALVTRAITCVIEAAIYDMPQGGILSIKDYRQGDMAAIQLTSNGLGNWTDDLASLYEPEALQDPLRSLGLVVARTFVEAHGGKLSIHSDRGKGTTFTIRLPI